MSHTEMLHLNLRSFSLLKSLFKINSNQMNHSFSIRFDPMISWWKIIVPCDTADSFFQS